MSLIEEIDKAAFSQMTRNASAKTGLNEGAIAALMPMATAMLMNVLKKNVEGPGGAEALAKALANAAGADPDQIAKLLAMAAPAILAGLGQAKREQGLDPGALAQLVKSESRQAEAAAPKELSGFLKWIDSDGDGRIDDNIASLALKGLGELFGKR